MVQTTRSPACSTPAPCAACAATSTSGGPITRSPFRALSTAESPAPCSMRFSTQPVEPPGERLRNAAFGHERPTHVHVQTSSAQLRLPACFSTRSCRPSPSQCPLRHERLMLLGTDRPLKVRRAPTLCAADRATTVRLMLRFRATEPSSCIRVLFDLTADVRTRLKEASSVCAYAWFSESPSSTSGSLVTARAARCESSRTPRRGAVPRIPVRRDLNA
jgi:hypothetical protein